MMFEKLLTKYGSDASDQNDLSGATFGGGLYRLHTPESRTQASEWIRRKWLDFSERIDCFGFDWMGRQFSRDPARLNDNGQPLVLLYEPGSGEALEIPATFEEFHRDIIIDMADAAVAEDLYNQWRRINPNAGPLAFDRCVGYRRPLFLGGEHVVGNLEESDLDVYWELNIQLVNHIRGYSDQDGPPRP